MHQTKSELLARMFLKYFAMEIRYCYRALLSVVMTIVIPLAFLFIYAFAYYVNTDSQALLIAYDQKVPRSSVQVLRDVKGIKLLTTTDTAEYVLKQGKALVVISWDPGHNKPMLNAHYGYEGIARLIGIAMENAQINNPSQHPNIELNVSKEEKTFAAIIPGIILMSLLNQGLFGAGSKLLEDRSTGNFRLFRTFSTPLSIVLCANIVAKTLLGLLQAVILFGFGLFLFGLQISVEKFFLIVLLLILSDACMIALGVAIGSTLPNYSNGIHFFTLTNLLMVFLGGMFFPVGKFALTYLIGLILPTSYCAELLRWGFLGTETRFPIMITMLIVVAYILIFTLVSITFFKVKADT
jgi:ABC-type multidrug transport system permease subunit